jgi:hypothetical protein
MDCHDREQVWRPSAARRPRGYGRLRRPGEAGDKAILDVRPYRRDGHGSKADRQRLWQVLTMRQGRIVRIQDATDQAAALQAAGLPTGP